MTDFDTLLSAAAGLDRPVVVGATVDELVAGGRLAPGRVPPGRLEVLASDPRDAEAGLSQAALAAVYRSGDGASYGVVTAPRFAAVDLAELRPVTAASLSTIRDAYAEWGAAGPAGPAASRPDASDADRLEAARTGVAAPGREARPARPAAGPRPRGTAAVPAHAAGAAPAVDLEARILDFVAAVPDAALARLGPGPGGARPAASVRDDGSGPFLRLSAEGRSADHRLEATRGFPALAAPPADPARASAVAAANAAMAEVAAAARLVPPAPPRDPGSVRDRAAAISEVLAAMPPAALSDLMTAAGHSAGPGPVAASNPRVADPAAFGAAKGREVLLLDVSCGGARPVPVAFAVDPGPSGPRLSVMPPSGRVSRFFAEQANRRMPQPWSGERSDAAGLAALVGDGARASVPVTAAELAAALGRPGGETVPRRRAADLAAVLFAVEQPRYDGAAVVGRSPGRAGAAELLDGFGAGRSPRRLHLDPRRLAALAAVAGPAGAALTLRLAASCRDAERAGARQRPAPARAAGRDGPSP